MPNTATCTTEGCFAGPLRNTDTSSNARIQSSIPHQDEVIISKKIASIFQKVGFALTDVLDSEGKGVYPLISAMFDKVSELTQETEEQIRELLKDHHSTYSLFEKGLESACEKAKNREKVFIDLYVHDLSNPAFVTTLQRAIEDGVDPEFLIIEIRREDHGILDAAALRNLESIIQLGFEFSHDAFSIRGDEIRGENLEKLAKKKLFPKYLKIASNIYTRLIDSSIKMSDSLRDTFNTVVSKGVRILFGKKDIEENDTKEMTEKKEPLIFLEKATVGTEDIFGADGKIRSQEGLIRFGDGVTVPDGLKKLKELGRTDELLDKVIANSVPVVKNGYSRTLNAYIKDIGADDFQDKVRSIMNILERRDRKYLTFEILEERYGSFNNRVIENIRFLQEKGFTIAIDDLYVGDDSQSMSKEILGKCFSNQITPDYIKIDGRHLKGILDGTITKKEIAELQRIISIFSKLPNKPIFILEWIQDSDHARQAIEVLGMKGVDAWFQGMNLKKGEFSLFPSKKAA